MTTALQQALEALDVAEAHLMMLLGSGAAAYPSLTFGQTIAAAQQRLREELKGEQRPQAATPTEIQRLNAENAELRQRIDVQRGLIAKQGGQLGLYLDEIARMSDELEAAKCQQPASDEPTLWAARHRYSSSEPWGPWTAINTPQELQSYRDPGPDMPDFELRQFRALPAGSEENQP